MCPMEQLWSSHHVVGEWMGGGGGKEKNSMVDMAIDFSLIHSIQCIIHMTLWGKFNSSSYTDVVTFFSHSSIQSQMQSIIKGFWWMLTFFMIENREIENKRFCELSYFHVFI